MILLCELENFIISVNKTPFLIWNLKQQMFTIKDIRREKSAEN